MVPASHMYVRDPATNVGNYAPSVASLFFARGFAAFGRRGLPMSRPSWAGHAPNATGSCDIVWQRVLRGVAATAAGERRRSGEPPQ